MKKLKPILFILCINTVCCLAQTTNINSIKEKSSSLCIAAQYDFFGNANDVSGNGNHGTVSGAMLTTDRFGNTNSAYIFDGIDDSITVLDDNTLDLTSGFTLSAWVYPYSYETGPIGNARIIDKPYVILAEPYSMYNMILWNDGRVHTSVSIGGVRTPQHNLQGSGVVPLNQWTNIQISYTGSALSIYINGQLDVTTAVSGSLDINTQNLTIGYYQNASNFFDGKIDDVKILGCGLSATQVDSMYQAEKPSSSLCTVAQYDFSGNTNDVSGHGNNGVLNGAVLTTNRHGMQGEAYSFDGVDDYIEVLGTGNVQIVGNELTLSAWIYPTSWRNTIYEGNVINKEDFNLAGYLMRVGNNGNLDFWVHTGVYKGVETTSSPLVLNVWQHIVGVYDGTKLVTYVNGQPIDTMLNVTGNITGSTIPLWIGASQFFTNRHFPGAIDDIKIMDCALTPTQVDSIYQAENTCIITNSISQTICMGDSTQLGTTWYSSTGTYTETFSLVSGCDSVVTLSLMVDTLDTAVLLNGTTLSSNSTGVNFQWLNCDNSFAIISGETSSAFTPTMSGNYAIEITNNTCVDTSSCYNVQIVNTQNLPNANLITLHPNPVNDDFVMLNLGTVHDFLSISLLTNTGQFISKKDYSFISAIRLELPKEAGVYFILIENNKGEKAYYNVVKNN